MLIESITLAQRDNKELEALIYRFRPLIRKCGRQLHIEDGEQEMVVAFIELIKRFRPETAMRTLLGCIPKSLAILE